MAEVGGSYEELLTNEQKDALHRVATAIVSLGKGILAADESTGKRRATRRGAAWRFQRSGLAMEEAHKLAVVFRNDGQTVEEYQL